MDGMFSNLLKPHLSRIYPCVVEEIRHNQQKELRIIETLEPVMNQHRLIIDPRVIQQDYETAKERYSADVAPQYMLFYQIARISKQRGSLKHDDRLDALAMAVRHFLDRLDSDQENMEKLRKDEMFDAYINKFIQESGQVNTQDTNFRSRLWNNLK